MRKHNGMRPHDIVVLAKILVKKDEEWQYRTLSYELCISISEISESLNRSKTAKLIDYEKRRVNKSTFIDFIEHGLPYVFPAELGALQRGVATAHSHPFMKQHFDSSIDYVWPDFEGNIVGMALSPLYDNQVKAVRADADLHKVLALIDVLRIGKTREINTAREELQKML